MISLDTFIGLVKEVLERDLRANPAQEEGVSYGGRDVLILVSGPGSGKTTILVLRALRHVLVDGILPEHLLITTFTRKAARELRTRWLDWGSLLLKILKEDTRLTDQIARIDLNRCRIDTLDSLAQQALTEHKLPGEVAPIVLEGSAVRLVLKRASFGEIYNLHQDSLDPVFARYTFDGMPPHNRGQALGVAKSLCERLIQDRVDLTSYGLAGRGFKYVSEILVQYQDRLSQTGLYDFALLELKLLERLQDRSLQDWSASIRALLIDEYQDTNSLQEQIYFDLIARSEPQVTVVGDDDQSMYRFRGGSVELFTQFAARLAATVGLKAKRIDMVANYRSSREIVDFYNAHVGNDAGFAPARILPAKGAVVSQRGELRMPVLGMFRPDPSTLADSLASWLEELFRRRSIAVSDAAGSYEIKLKEEGDFGDCVVLAHSIEEVKYNRYNGSSEPRFVAHLRNAMRHHGVELFNPRGRALRTIASVQQLLGLLLLCLDPDGQRSEAVFPTNEARYFLSEWRGTALAFVAQNPPPNDNGGLDAYVSAWQSVSRGREDKAFPSDWPVLELIFKLITWIPGFQGDPEHQVWLEAIARTVSAAGMASPYGMQILKFDIHRDRSRESFIRDVLLPIAENEVDVDEDIMPSVPRNRLQLMTIHQSKGLEFPLVIVDVGAQFTGNWQKQRFLRFPEAPSNVVLMEDDVEPHLSQPLRGHRPPMDRTFDDLTRLYYVAYSRPQSVLMLVGCEKCLAYGRGRNLATGAIPNIALGWVRDGSWPWRGALNGGRPPIRVTPPMLLL